VFVAIYAVIIIALTWLIQHVRIARRYAVFLSPLIFGVVTGILVVWLWPLDSSVLPNIFGVWLGDWIYHQAIAWIGDPNSGQAHNTIPWVFQIPQVYAIASTGLFALMGLVLQWAKQVVLSAGARKQFLEEAE
jgi:hypothetical protein